MASLIDSHLRLISALGLGYSVALFAISWVVAPCRCRPCVVTVFSRRLLILNLAAAVFVTCGPGVLRGTYGSGSLAGFGEDIAAFPDLVAAPRTYMAAVFLLNASLLFPAGLAGGLARSSAARVVGASAATAGFIEVAQFLALQGVASVDDVVLNTTSSALGFFAGRALRRFVVPSAATGACDPVAGA
ncbi:MAG: VanZ family protein [Actinomycetales bacterium]|nr:VanZ family protein [Actinomycetales bacterium]